MEDDNSRGSQHSGGLPPGAADTQMVPPALAAGTVYVTPSNMMMGVERYAVAPGDTRFWFFFERADVTSPQSAECSFANMSSGMRALLKILCYVAHSCEDASVHLLYLEPEIPELSRAELSLHIRCMLTNHFCLIFTVPSQNLVVPGMDDLFEQEERENHVINMATEAAKRAIAVDLNLVSHTGAFIMRSNAEASKALIDMYDFDTWQYRHDVLTTKRRGGNAHQLEKPLVAGNDTCLKYTSLLTAIYGYLSRDQQATAHLLRFRISADTMLGYFFAGVTNPRRNPVFDHFSRTYPNSRAETFVSDVESSRSPSLGRYMIFRYNLEHLISKDSFQLFEAAPFLSYPEGSGSRDEVAAGMVTQVRARSAGRTRTKFGSDFGLVWPHLHAFHELCRSSPIRGPEMEILRVKTRLFYSVVLSNTDHVATEPTRGIYRKIKRALDSRHGIASMARGRIAPVGPVHAFSSADVTCAPRMADIEMLREVMVRDLNLLRCAQAFFTVTQVLHATCPKWNEPRLMLVNYTRSGTGKSYTGEAVRKLFARVDSLFGHISSLTDTVFKYLERTVGRIISMDDVGFSKSQQRGSKREDGLVTTQFKSLLDTGYTVNMVTERTPGGRFHGSQRIMVFNAAFVWNTNTLESFSDAWVDRCLIVGDEPSAASGSVPHCTRLPEDRWDTLQRNFETRYLRHHLTQTLIYTCVPELGGANERLRVMLRDTTRSLEQRFPVVHSNVSNLRSNHKLTEMAMAQSLRIAVDTVFDWWVPPWTVAPEFLPHESSAAWCARLDANRLEALQRMGMSELVVETLAQHALLVPSCALETAAALFNQSTGQVLRAVTRLLARSFEHGRRGVYTVDADGGAREVICVNHVPKFSPDSLLSDRTVLVQAQTMTFRIGSRTIKLVEEVGQTSVKLNGRFVLEIIKKEFDERLRDVHAYFRHAFSAQLDRGERLRPVRLTANTVDVESDQRAFLALLGTCQETCRANGSGGIEVVVDASEGRADESGPAEGSNAGVLVSPHFAGLATEIFLERARALERVHSLDEEALEDARAALTKACRSFLTHTYRAPQRKDCTGGFTALLTHLHTTHAYTFFDAKIEWFSAEHMTEILDSNGFGHARCGAFPSGPRVTAYSAPAAQGPGPEREDAEAIYRRFLREWHSDDLTRYLTFTGSAQRCAREDPYLLHVARTLPSGSDCAARRFDSRYGCSEHQNAALVPPQRPPVACESPAKRARLSFRPADACPETGP